MCMSNIIKMSKKCSKVNTSLKKVDSTKTSEPSEQEKLALLLQQEHKKGIAEGERIWRVKLENEFKEKMQIKYAELDSFMQKISDKLIDYETQFESTVLNTSFMLTEKILRRQLLQQSSIKEILEDSLQKVIGANEIIVRLNTHDFEEILSEGKNYNMGDSFSKIRFEKDDRIEVGGCFIESEIGNADGRISSMFNELKKKFDSEES